MSEQDLSLPETVRRFAAMVGLQIDPIHLTGVARNLDILLAQAQLLFETPPDPLVEPAAELHL